MDEIFWDQDIDPNNILQDMHELCEPEIQFLDHLQSKQQNNQSQEEYSEINSNRFLGTARYPSGQHQRGDDRCQVCNEIKQVDNDQLLTCSVCKIIVHQKCYGYEDMIPLEGWICELCNQSGSRNKDIMCPLCTCNGGIMKQSDEAADSNLFEMTNPIYNEYLKNLHPYDQVWVHLTCAYWIPECYFQQPIVLGLKSIDKKRYNLQCNLCRSRRAGACVQCSEGKCQLAFHPECARRSNAYMEINQYNQTFNIYCQKHQPLKLKRIFENQIHKHTEEIQHFCYILDRAVAHMNNPRVQRLYNRRQIEEPLRARNRLIIEKQKEIQLTEQNEVDAAIDYENKQLLNQLREFLRNTTINKIVVEIWENKIQVILPQTKSGEENLLRLKRDDAVWNHFWFGNFQPDEIFIFYKRALRMRRQQYLQKKTFKKYQKQKNEYSSIQKKNKSIKKIINKKIRKNYSQKFINQKKNLQSQIIVQKKYKSKISLKNHKTKSLDQLYCVCQKPFNNEEMMQCENCKEWYHLKCLGFIQGLDQAEKMEFHCFQCWNNIKNPVYKRQLKQLYKESFADPSFKNLKNISEKQKIQFKKIQKTKRNETKEELVQNKYINSNGIESNGRALRERIHHKDYKNLDSENLFHLKSNQSQQTHDIKIRNQKVTLKKYK